MTKKDYVTAIVRLYFHDYHPEPAKKSNAYTAEDLAQTRKILLAGEGGIFFFTGMTRNQAKYELYHYSCGRGFFSLKELHLITKALGIKILPTKESMIYVLLNWMEDRGIIRANIVNPTIKLDYDAAFDETAYSPDVQEVSVIVDDIPADHEPDNYCAVFTVGYRYVFHGAEYTIVKKTAKTITMKYMDVLGVQTQTRKLYIDSRSEYTYPEGTYGAGMDAPEWQLRADGPFIPANPQTSQPAITAPVQEVKSNTPANPEPEPARKSAPKPATRKHRHAVKTDETRQILIQFDSEDTPAPASTPAKPKARRTHKPRVKRDYSRQILIDFGENIPDGQTNQKKAA